MSMFWDECCFVVWDRKAVHLDAAQGGTLLLWIRLRVTGDGCLDLPREQELPHQRLTPACFLSPPPQLLLYDEPTAGLDPVASTVVEDLIRSLHYSEESQHLVHGAHSSSSSGSSTNGSSSSGSSNGAGTNGNGAAAAAAAAAAAHRAPPPPRINTAPPEEGGVSSYIVVTHQHSTIRRSVDRLIFLHEGRVVSRGFGTS